MKTLDFYEVLLWRHSFPGAKLAPKNNKPIGCGTPADGVFCYP